MIVRGRLRSLLAAALVAALSVPAVAQQGPSATSRCELIPRGPSTRISTDSATQAAYIGGGLTVKCPDRSITLQGDSAQRLTSQYYVIGHVVYDEPRLHLTSDYLTYYLTDERVVATSNVHARLPNGSTLVGPVVTLLREAPHIRPRQQIITAGRPTIQIASTDSAGKPEPPTTIVAEHVFMDGDSLIYGGGQVVITNQDVRATADSAFIDEPDSVTHLMRKPTVVGKRDRPFSLAGDLIDLYSDNKKLERIISRANAVAVSDSMTLTSDTIDLRMRDDRLQHAYAWGKSRAKAVSPSQTLVADSLDVTMPNQRLQLVRALHNAFAQSRPDTVRFVLDHGDTTDRLFGDTILAYFDTTPPKDTSKGPNITELIASGHASAYYHLAASDSSERRPAINYVRARIVTVHFSQQNQQQKVETVTNVDSVFGVYIEPSDTTQRAAPGRTPGKQPPKPQGPRSIVPLPPPKRPPLL